jgi:hypothetical protein
MMVPWKMCGVGLHVSRLTRSHAAMLNQAVTGPREVDNEAVWKKIEKYSELATRYQFTPIAIKTLGPISTEATSFLQELGRRIVTVTLEMRSMSFLCMAGTLSVAVQRAYLAQNSVE